MSPLVVDGFVTENHNKVKLMCVIIRLDVNACVVFFQRLVPGCYLASLFLLKCYLAHSKGKNSLQNANRAALPVFSKPDDKLGCHHQAHFFLFFGGGGVNSFHKSGRLFHLGIKICLVMLV